MRGAWDLWGAALGACNTVGAGVTELDRRKAVAGFLRDHNRPAAHGEWGRHVPHGLIQPAVTV